MSIIQTMVGTDAVCRSAIDQALARDHFAVVRGVVSPAAVERALCRLRAAFRPEDDHPTTGERPEDVRGNFQKLAVGTVARNGGQQVYARLLRVIYSPLFAPDRFGVHEVLRPVAVLRNRLLGLADGFALDGIESGVWTATRIQQYPSGGGFLSTHVDGSTVALSERLADRYLQLLLVMTRRGRDFESGGAYIEHSGERVDVEALLEPGDVLVYDGRTTHGVADIDPTRPLDLGSLGGRIVGLVNVYEAR